MISKKELDLLKKEFPENTRIRLIQMDDIQAPYYATKGTVKGVDDTGSLLVQWDNGSTLNVLYGIDRVEKVEKDDSLIPATPYNPKTGFLYPVASVFWGQTSHADIEAGLKSLPRVLKYLIDEVNEDGDFYKDFVRFFRIYKGALPEEAAIIEKLVDLLSGYKMDSLLEVEEDEMEEALESAVETISLGFYDLPQSGLEKVMKMYLQADTGMVAFYDWILVVLCGWTMHSLVYNALSAQEGE